MAGSFLDVIRVAVSDFGAELAIDTRGGLRVSVSAERALGLLSSLRQEPESSMRRLVDLTAIDLEGKPRRFEVVYWLHSPGLCESLRVHVELDESSLILDSVVEQWPDANWLEREVFDLFGIEFRAHPDLRRIFLDQDFEGAPLRKDYPRQPNLDLPKAAKA